MAGIFAKLAGRGRFLTLGVACVMGLWSANTSSGQGNYYPDTSSPVTSNALSFVELGLPPNVTLAVPTPAGKSLATDAQLAAALAGALQSELTANGFLQGTLDDLITAATLYRPTAGGALLSASTSTIIAFSASVEADIQMAAARTATAAGAGAGLAIKDAVASIASGPNGIYASVIVKGAVAATPQNAADIVFNAVRSAGSITPPASYLAEIKDITKEAIVAAGNNGARNQFAEILAAVAGNTSTIAPVELVNAVLTDASPLLNSPITSPEDTAAVVVGILRGTSFSVANTTAIVNQANTLRPANSTYTTAVGAGFNTARGTNASASVAVIGSLMNSQPNNIAAIAIGATAAWNRSAAQYASQALYYDNANNGTNTTEQIITAILSGLSTTSYADLTTIGGVVATAAAQGNASETAVYGQIARAAVAVTDISIIGSVVKKEIDTVKATDTVNRLEEIVTAAVASSFINGKGDVLGDIAYFATKAVPTLNTNVVTKAIDAAEANGGGAFTYRAAAGVAAANGLYITPATANAIKTAALAANDGTNDGDVGAAIDTVAAILKNTNTLADFYNLTTDQLTAGGLTPSKAAAIITGSSYANPAGAGPVASLATVFGITAGYTPAQLAAISLEAEAANRPNARGVALATATTRFIRANPNGIFTYVDSAIFNNPAYAVDITQGAVVADPSHAHVIASAAAFRAGVNNTGVIASLFKYAQLDNKLTSNPVYSSFDAGAPGIVNPVDAVAAISAGFTVGINNAFQATPNMVPTGDHLKAVKNAVTTAANQAFAISSSALIKQSNGVGTDPNNPAHYTMQTQKGNAGVMTGSIAQAYLGEVTVSQLVATVITAVVKESPGQGPAVIQAAATALRAIAGSMYSITFTDSAGIKAAVVAAGSGLSSTYIDNVIQFGFNQADLWLASGPTNATRDPSLAGAGAAGIRNYDHASGTNAPVTSIFNL